MGRKQKPLAVVFFRLSDEDKAIMARMAREQNRIGGASDLYRVAVKEYIARCHAGTPSALPMARELET